MALRALLRGSALGQLVAHSALTKVRRDLPAARGKSSFRRDEITISLAKWRLLGRRPAAFPERIGCIVVTATATEEHQGHKPAPDEERKEGAETQRNPAVLIHYGVAAGVPHGYRPNAGEDEEAPQNHEKDDLTKAKLLHRQRLFSAAYRRMNHRE